MNLITLKIICIPIIFAVPFVGGLIPYLYIRHQRSTFVYDVHHFSSKLTLYLSLANCFSSGVFLSTCFIGIFPGVKTKFDKLLKDKSNIHYPIAELTLCLGFFLVWALDIIMHSCVSWYTGESHKEMNTGPACIDSSKIASNGVQRQEMDQQCTQTDGLYSDDDADDNAIEVTEVNELITNKSKNNSNQIAHSHVHGVLPLDGTNNSLLNSILLTIALGSHSILEGMGFGLFDTKSQVMNMLAAILIHETLCALSLGINFASGSGFNRSWIAILLLVMFSSLIPIGIVIGLIFEHSTTSEKGANVIGKLFVTSLQGIVCGTFIYVIFCEILPNELTSGTRRLFKMLSMFFGFSTLALLKVIQSEH